MSFSSKEIFLLFMITFYLLLLSFKHLLTVIILFEYFILGGILTMSFFSYSMSGSEIIFLSYLLMGVFEGMLGLSLLVMIIRSTGNDYLLMKYLVI